MEEQLLETWHIHARVNLYLLDAVVADALACGSGVCASAVVSSGVPQPHRMPIERRLARAPAFWKALNRARGVVSPISRFLITLVCRVFS